MGTCDNLIKGDILRNCDDPLVKGLEREGILINRDDIDYAAVTFAEGSSNIISALPLKKGKRAYRVVQTGSTPFTGTKSTMESGANVNTVSHELALTVLDNSPKVAENIVDGLLNGEFVAILENKYKGLRSGTPGASAFQIYGFHQGLRMSSGEADKYGEETNGGWAIVLKEEKAPKSAMYLFANTYAATQALIDTLKAGAVVE